MLTFGLSSLHVSEDTVKVGKAIDNLQGCKNNPTLRCHWCDPILPSGMTLQVGVVNAVLY
mgnify:CR=1 FL=1